MRDIGVCMFTTCGYISVFTQILKYESSFNDVGSKAVFSKSA